MLLHGSSEVKFTDTERAPVLICRYDQPCFSEITCRIFLTSVCIYFFFSVQFYHYKR